jgi:hypothetical protein
MTTRKFLGCLVPSEATVVSQSDEFYDKELLPADMDERRF